jgi:hypothetical protein
VSSSGLGNRLKCVRWSLGLALSVLSLAALGGEARAAWLPAEAASPVESRIEEPQIAVDAAGDTTVVWTSGEAPNRTIRSAFRPAGGGWETPFTRMSATFDCHDPQLAVNATGAAVLAAECEKPSAAIRAAYRPAASWNGSIEIAGSAGGSAPRAGIAPGGDADVVAAHRPAAGSWSTGAQIGTVGKPALNPDLAVSPGGYAWAIYREKREEPAGSDPVIEAKVVRRSPGTGGTWTAPFRLSSNFGPGSSTPVVVGEPQVAIGVNGQRIMAWSQTAGGNVSMLERASGGDLSTIEEPSRSISESGASVEEPRVAIDGNGDSIATWRTLGTGIFPTRTASTPSLSTGFGPSATVSGLTSNSGSTQPEVAVDGAGRATIAWLGLGSVRTSTRPAGGAFPELPTEVTRVGLGGFDGPALTMTAGGDSLVAWSTGNTVAFAVEDVTPPTLSAIATGPVEVGATATFSATAGDVWGPVSVSWDFGDGASASGASASHSYATPGTKTATATATDSAGNVSSATVQVEVSSPSPPGGGGAGGGTPPTSSPPPLSGPKQQAVKLSASVVPQSWEKQAMAKAVRVRCKLDLTGRCAAVATVTKAVAKQLGLPLPKRKGPVRIGSGKAAATANRFTVVIVKLGAKPLAAITASPKPIPLAIAVTATAPGRAPAAKTVRTTLRP